MTVKELKEQLTKYDENLEVYLDDWQEGYLPPTNRIALDDNYAWDDRIDGLVLTHDQHDHTS